MMPFTVIRIFIHSNTASLRAAMHCLRASLPAAHISLFPKSRSRHLTSPKHLLGAGVTVEASLVFPVLIFFMCNVLYLFEMIQLECDVLAALHETGTRMCEYAYYCKAMTADRSDNSENALSAAGISSFSVSLLLSETWVRNNMNDYLSERYDENSCLEGGTAAISYLRSSVLNGAGAGEDIISITADYRVRPFIDLIAPDGFSMENHFYGHAFVGYTPGNSSEDIDSDSEEIVFVTASGSVYHRSRSCSYLNPSVRAVSSSMLFSLRNSGGGKYYPCEICRPSGTGILYITEDGNRFHSSAGCSGIKRAVTEVPLSSVEGKLPPCSKCGGR